jgi:hypothetical protein
MTDDTELFKFRALDGLLGPYMPTLRKKGIKPRPLLHADPVPVEESVIVPGWDWSREGAEHFDRIALDANAAFISPLSGTEFAHNRLVHTGPQEFNKLPGYWLIDAHSWPDSRIVSPLGQGIRARGRIWLATPTVALLAQLYESGHWPDLTVHDSWTPEFGAKVRFKEWAAWIRDSRAATFDPEDLEARQHIKDGYSAAVTMMGGLSETDRAEGTKRAKSKMRRPDWKTTIRAQSWANMWRKAWNCVQAGVPVMGMRETDELIFASEDVDFLKALDPGDKRTPLRFDQSGLTLGTFKEKSFLPAQAEAGAIR